MYLFRKTSLLRIAQIVLGSGVSSARNSKLYLNLRHSPHVDLHRSAIHGSVHMLGIVVCKVVHAAGSMSLHRADTERRWQETERKKKHSIYSTCNLFGRCNQSVNFCKHDNIYCVFNESSFKYMVIPLYKKSRNCISMVNNRSARQINQK